MKTTAAVLGTLLLCANTAPLSVSALGQDSPMVPQIPSRPEKGPISFFVTSVGMGDGANLGGLAGADTHCQKLAKAVGAEDRTWRAYLSTQATVDERAINARDRIGQGPWYNANGVRIAAHLGQLHGDTLELARKGNFINIRTAVTEAGDIVPGEVRIVGVEARNQHDILTGTKPDGTAFTDTFDRTCSNWTSNREDGSANVGHHDRITSFTSQSWVDAHPSRGCSQENLISTGGAGQFYCFASD
ncbi:MAG: hypothetical protein P8L66_10890 [Rhodospirillaceae bacterium]|nr:hypothetical protein [Rhodospirillaceae bacterium]